MRILVVDNYDSFTFNLVQYLGQLGAETVVRRNDEVTTADADGYDGVLLSPGAWHELADRLRAAGTTFVIDPDVRFPGQVGEQWTMFLLDPSGNALEFKAFADDAQIFAR